MPGAHCLQHHEVTQSIRSGLREANWILILIAVDMKHSTPSAMERLGMCSLNLM